MRYDFWKDRWDTNQIGFHQSEPTRALVEHATLLPAPPARVLVPLCGKSIDLVWLMRRGYEVIGIEFVARALDAFFEEQRIATTRREEPDRSVFEGPHIRAIAADFFDVTPTDTGPVDLVFDRAALVALPPDMRARYAQHVLRFLDPGARMLLVAFEYDASKMDGPPFSVDETEVRSHYERAGTLERVARRDILDEEPRFRERGLDYLFETVWNFARTT